MPIKVSKLWGNFRFQGLSKNSKLLYIYLATDPNLDIVGVTVLNIDLLMFQLYLTLEEVREASKELVDKGFIHVGKYDGEIYCVVLDHFNIAPKADTTVNRINKALKALPNKLVLKLKEFGISSDKKIITFVPPTRDEVLEYSASQGYIVDAEKFCSYYENNGKRIGKDGQWYDSKGRQVKDWKAKMRVVWFRDEHKLKKVEGAPKGFEFFYVKFEDSIAYPDYWKDGKPFSKNLIVTKELQKEYENRKKNSKKIL